MWSEFCWKAWWVGYVKQKDARFIPLDFELVGSGENESFAGRKVAYFASGVPTSAVSGVGTKVGYGAGCTAV